MSEITPKFLDTIYPKVKETSLFGKWITFPDIAPLYKTLSDVITSEILGTSEENRPIYKLTLGSGKKKILIWSQMHGNESTGTRAVFDFLNFVREYKESTIVQKILKETTIQIIPMLNPDGALAYTRVNANQVDLNRDAVDIFAKESRILRGVLDIFQPDFCFNLHDQRTIFGVEGTKNPATISFLAPSEEITRKVTKGRKETMDVIVAMNNLLQQIIPNSVGLYTDEFYPTATGDNFQKLGHNCVLIEAGHYPNDYNREETRKFNFYALLMGIYHISSNDVFNNYEPYASIPENNKAFYDVIHRNKNKEDIAFLYKDEIIKNKLTSTLIAQKEVNLIGCIGHKEIVLQE